MPMQIKPDEITSILKSRIQGLDSTSADLTEVGTVLSVADGICRVHGLENCMSFEMLQLPHDVTGLALNLESDNVGAVLFGNWEKVVEGDTVRRTKRLLEIPVDLERRLSVRAEIDGVEELPFHRLGIAELRAGPGGPAGGDGEVAVILLHEAIHRRPRVAAHQRVVRPLRSALGVHRQDECKNREHPQHG